MAAHILNILVIDDDADDVEILRRRLDSNLEFVCDLIHLSDPETAVEGIRHHPADLVFIDYHLGCRTGLQVLEAVRAAGCTLPIIMLTGQGSEAVATECMRAGADDYVTKCDLSVDTLRRTIEHARTRYAQRRAEAEIEQLARLSSESPDPILRVEAQGLILYANQASERLLRTWDAFRGDRVPEELCEVIADVIRTGDRRTLPFDCDGRHYDVVFVGVDHDYVNLYGRDITNLKLAEQSLREKDAQLRQKQRHELIGSLAGGVAHEFNNLLQIISGYTAFAMEELPVDSQAYKDLENAVVATDRAASITGQLLSFSRRQSVDRKCCDLSEVVRDQLRMLKPLLGERIELTISAGDGLTAFVDRQMIEQAILNLCLNSQEAMPDGGEIFISAHHTTIDEGRPTRDDVPAELKPGTYVRLAVTDTGAGIPPEIQNQIFDPFFTTKEVGEGTGMGLPFVYGVVQQHEGAIHLRSVLGEGTTFGIYLPSLVESAMPVKHDAVQPVAEFNETILIAEDEPLVRDIALRTLRRAGYDVLTAANGNEAVEVFRANADRIDLLLSDVIMPKMGGHEAYCQMQQIKPDLKAIFCSGYDPETANTQSLVTEGLQIIQKPFEASQLIRVVRDVLAASPDTPEIAPAT